MIAAGFSYEVVTAHNGCLQMEVTVHGKMSPRRGAAHQRDALQGAVFIMNALYARTPAPKVAGITPYLNIGRIGAVPTPT